MSLLRRPHVAKQFGEAGRERVAKLFTAERMALQTLRVYHRLVGADETRAFAERFRRREGWLENVEVHRVGYRTDSLF